jgi:hypothetical protein
MKGQTIQWAKGLTMIYKTLLSKLNIEQHESTKIRSALRCSERMSISLNHKECDIPHARGTR